MKINRSKIMLDAWDVYRKYNISFSEALKWSWDYSKGINMDKFKKEELVIAWWSGGVTSAVACKLALDLYPNVEVVMIDTHYEHLDTYRFKDDCEKWYGQKIKIISAIPDKYSCIDDVWDKYTSLNVAHGAICSTELKREVREAYQERISFKHQVFGFDIDEPKRAKMLAKNHRDAKAIFTLLLHGLSKLDCINIIKLEGIEIPEGYKLGFHNNNCLGKDEDEGGCVQGGIGYWQLFRIYKPKAFYNRAMKEHELTDIKGKPVTMLKDQSKAAKKSGKFQVFLLPHPDYPDYKDLSMMEGREPKPLMECNGFCGTNDLLPINETEKEINFQIDIFN
jgi:hypothetical protein